MRFVPKKTLQEQDIQALHRARQRLANHRTALISRMRGSCSGHSRPRSSNCGQNHSSGNPGMPTPCCDACHDDRRTISMGTRIPIKVEARLR
jgi:hypothetical protein